VSGAAAPLQSRARKAPSAFRTISEVADDLHIPQHVLRFWETKFPQLKPLKRGGGRRYYRPEDISLLRRVSDLLYTQGYTIKGVQRLLREGGLDEAIAAAGAPPAAAAPEPPETGVSALRAILDELEDISASLHDLLED
jgi:DNA-binding transcriptional MerR regulator